VAYADFTTAMMAFFMLLWLLTVSDKEQLSGIADYFTPSNATMSNSSGSGEILAGSSPAKDGAKADGSISTSAPSANAEDESQPNPSGAQDSQTASTTAWETKMPTMPDAQLLKAEEDIKTAIQETPELQRHKDQIILEQTPDGLRIQLVDKDQRPMFRSGTAELYPFTQRLLSAIAGIIEALPNRLSIQGHTDQAGTGGNAGYGNWELSADRANAARRALANSGVSADRFAEATGKADTDPLYPDAAGRPENRRVSLLLIREAPAFDPSFGTRAPAFAPAPVASPKPTSPSATVDLQPLPKAP
jgi:chemotaxis protein MotB